MPDNQFNKRLAENLSDYRRLNNLSQAELAECLGYSNKSVSKWECGDGTPDIFTLVAISEIYGITVSELIGQTDMSKETKDKIKAVEKDKKGKEHARKKALKRAKKQKKKQ